MSLNLNSYLKGLSYHYFIGRNTTESNKIDTSVNTLDTNLKYYFGNKISQVCTFGSYTRDTILPRRYDENSDVDVMIIFDHEKCGVQPETDRKWLLDFANTKYSRSSVTKDFPTVVIDMQHIKLDLVPTIVERSFLSGTTINIPNNRNNWQSTDPNGFNNKLVKANTNYNSIVKPIIRLLKAWNCNNGYPYSSYELEQIVADMNFGGDNFETGFYYAIDRLPTNGLTYSNEQRVDTLRYNINWVKEYQNRNDMVKAKEWLNKILPYV